MSNDLTLYDSANWWSKECGFYLLNKMNPGRFSYFDRYVKNWDQLSVLDVGCGGGFTCEFMARRGARVTGIDSSQNSLHLAAQHAQQGSLKIDYLLGSATALPFDSSSFDAVTCVDVLEHIPSWDLALREIHRVLRPGGHFLFDTINRSRFSGFLMVSVFENILKLIPRGTHDPKLFIRPAELQNAMQTAGYSHISMTGFNLLWLPWQLDYRAVVGGPKSLMYIGHALKKE